MAYGKGCKCGAYGACECGCPDVDWTPQEIYDLRSKLKEAENTISEAHAILDGDESKIIRNAKDGYLDGRPDRILTLAERVKAICKYGADYKRWLSEAEDRLANSWEKRTVEEIDEFMHQFSGYGSSDSEVATALVKFLEEKRI